jgi:hypothetical protein
MAGMWVVGTITTLWVALGSWVAVFPGTLEGLFGLKYDFRGTWGVSRATYEALTLGTLGVILLIAVVGYIMGRPVRAHVAEIALEPDVAAPAPAPAT